MRHTISNQIMDVLGQGQVTVEDIVKNLGAHRVTVYRWLASGKLKPDHQWGNILLFKTDTVKNFIAGYMLPGSRRSAVSGKYRKAAQYLKYLDTWTEKLTSLKKDMAIAGQEKDVPEKPFLYDVRATCRILIRSRRQVYRYIKEKKLVPVEKCAGEWLFKASDIDSLKGKE